MEQWQFIIPASVLAVWAVLGIFYKIAAWKIGVDKNIEAVDRQLLSMNTRAEEDRNLFGTIVAEIRNDIKQILLILDPNPTVARSSPYKLTVYGESVAEAMETHAWALDVANSVLQDVKGMRPFEIDKYCQSNIGKFVDKNLREKIEDFAYNQGGQSSSIEAVFAVVLRDTLLKLIEDGEGDEQ